jgi:hypothetical protein
MYLMPLSMWFICYSKRLFSVQMSAVVRFWCCAVIDRSNKASGWQIEAMYTLRARCSRYSCYASSPFLLTGWIFFPWSFWVRCIVPSGSIVTIHLLNIRLNAIDSSSLGFAVNWAFCSSLSSEAANSSEAKNRVSSVCIPTTPKASFLMVISRQGSYDEVVMCSFSLWCL